MPVPRSVIVSRGMRGICQNGNFSKRDFPGGTFSAPTVRGARTASACSFLTGGEFFACIKRGSCALRSAGTCADAARAHKRDGHQGFHPSCESPRFLLVSACQRAETMGERQRIFSTVGEHSVLPCLDLFAVSDSVLLRIRFHLRRRDITVSRNFWARYTGRHLRICLFGTIYLRRCCLL